MFHQLCIAQGTWQILTLAAGLRAADEERQDDLTSRHLVLYDPEGLSEMRRLMNSLALGVGKWSSIRWADELITIRPHEASWPPPVDEWLHKIKELVNGVEVDEIWLPHLDGFIIKLFVEANLRAKVVIYEDGFLSRLQVRRISSRHVLRLARAWPCLIYRSQWRSYTAALRLYDPQLSRFYVRRIKALYLMLTPPVRLPAPYPSSRLRKMKKDHLKIVLREAECTDKVKDELALLTDTRDGDILLLTCSFWKCGIISYEKELQLLSSVTSMLLERGYRVWVKEHPREKKAWYPALKNKNPSNRLLKLMVSSALPVQLAVSRMRLSACVASASASLFYLRSIYGVPSYTFARQYLEHGCADDDVYGFSEVCSLVPDVMSIPSIIDNSSRN